MAIPVAAGIVLVSSLVQLYNSARERGESAERLAKIEKMFDAIKPPDLDVTLEDPPEVIFETLKDPTNADFVNQKSNQLKYSFIEYMPELEEFIAQEDPTLIEDNEITNMGRDAQLRGVEELEKASKNEYDPIFRNMVEKAQNQFQQQAQGRQSSVMQNFAQRGLGGSGVELAAHLGGNADIYNQLGEMNQDAAGEAYKRRLEAIMGGANLGRGLATDERDKQSFNANSINRFNESLANRNQNTMSRNVAAQNLGKRSNIENFTNQQAGANKAIMYGNEQRNSNRKYMGDLEQQKFANKVALANGMNGIAANADAGGIRRTAGGNKNLQGFGEAAALFAEKLEKENEEKL